MNVFLRLRMFLNIFQYNYQSIIFIKILIVCVCLNFFFKDVDKNKIRIRLKQIKEKQLDCKIFQGYCLNKDKVLVVEKLMEYKLKNY